ncbi:hypothetical protein F5141DRAFT_737691 [Pisolithus sp. B1]|nr:hypothetical protein F5141DRAFT_737691 [Pisolithus sp. B1]
MRLPQLFMLCGPTNRIISRWLSIIGLPDRLVTLTFHSLKVARVRQSSGVPCLLLCRIDWFRYAVRLWEVGVFMHFTVTYFVFLSDDVSIAPSCTRLITQRSRNLVLCETTGHGHIGPSIIRERDMTSSIPSEWGLRSWVCIFDFTGGSASELVFNRLLTFDVVCLMIKHYCRK